MGSGEPNYSLNPNFQKAMKAYSFMYCKNLNES